jgi:hypothetical protein
LDLKCIALILIHTNYLLFRTHYITMYLMNKDNCMRSIQSYCSKLFDCDRQRIMHYIAGHKMLIVAMHHRTEFALRFLLP